MSERSYWKAGHTNELGVALSKSHLVGDVVFEAGAIRSLTLGTSAAGNATGYEHGVPVGEGVALGAHDALAPGRPLDPPGEAGDTGSERNIGQDAAPSSGDPGVLNFEAPTPRAVRLESRLELSPTPDATLASAGTDAQPQDAPVTNIFGWGDTSGPEFSKLYIVGDSIFDAGAINMLTFGTPIGDYSAFGYSYRTNLQDVDGDGIEDGEPYAQQLVTVLGLADGVHNEAVAGAEAVRDFTFEQHIDQDSPFGVSILDVLNFQGRTPPSESLGTHMDLSGQMQRTLAAFEADGRPEDAAAIITIGSNDFISFLSANIGFIGENAAALGALVSGGPLDIPGVIADPATPEPIRQFLIEIVTILTGTIQATVGAIDTFVAAGFDTVIFANNPSFFTPLVQVAPGLPEGFADLIQPFALAIFDAQNAGVEAAIAARDADALITTQFEVIDAFSMLEQIFKDPASFGILNLSQPVFLDTPIGAVDPGTGNLFFLAPPNPLYPDGISLDQSVYFDSVHFTANTHDILTVFSGASLTRNLQMLTDEADHYRSSWLTERSFGVEDVVFADLGDDRVFTGDGDDVAFGGGGNDRLLGGLGNDILAGGSGDDQQFGGWGADVLAGQDGDDLLVGGADADFLFDGLGSDVARGGGGSDVFLHVAEELIGGTAGSGDADLFVGGWGDDTLLLVIADAAERDLAIDAIEAGRGGGGRLGDFAIAELGIAATGIERVLIFDRLVLPDDATADDDLAEAIASADLWSVLPAAEGGTGLADAAYDSAQEWLAG